MAIRKVKTIVLPKKKRKQYVRRADAGKTGPKPRFDKSTFKKNTYRMSPDAIKMLPKVREHYSKNEVHEWCNEDVINLLILERGKELGFEL
jgi:hypothetical protein